MIDIENELTAMLQTRAARIDPAIRIDEITPISKVTALTPSSEDTVELWSMSGKHRPKRRFELLATTAACLVLAVVGIVVVSSRDTERDARPAPSPEASSTDRSASQTAPTGTSTLLVPTASKDVVTVQRKRIDGSRVDNGAVIGPDGTVFGLNLYPTPFIGDDDAFETKTTSAIVDKTGSEQIYTNIQIGCATVTVTTAGDVMSNTEIEKTFAESISIAGDSVIANLPSGWVSLGSASVSEIYVSELSATIDGTQVEVSMRQAIGAPVGFFLTSMETPPVDVSNDNQTLWHVASAMMPSYNTVVGERGGTAFSISARAPLDTLTAVVAELVAIPRNDWLQQAANDESVTTNKTEARTESDPPPGCDLAPLAITTQ